MSFKTDPQTTVGHIHLRVADLDRAIWFYSDVLGFEVQQKFGDEAAFLSAGGYHHHIGLNTWHSKGGSPAPASHTGLYHAAFLYPDRKALATIVKRVVAAGIKVQGAADHGVSEAVYISDPDGNGIELYWDRPDAEWPRNHDGSIAMKNERLNVERLLSEAA